MQRSTIADRSPLVGLNPPLAQLERLASGLTPFDIRPRGYSYAEARAFFEAIGQLGRRYNVSPELVIDTVYPTYAVSRGLAL